MKLYRRINIFLALIAFMAICYFLPNNASVPLYIQISFIILVAVVGLASEYLKKRYPHL